MCVCGCTHDAIFALSSASTLPTLSAAQSLALYSTEADHTTLRGTYLVLQPYLMITASCDEIPQGMNRATLGQWHSSLLCIDASLWKPYPCAHLRLFCL